MKKVFTIFLLLIIVSAVSFAQPDTRGFSFQGYAIDANGNALGSTSVNVQFSLYPAGGSVEYSEVHTTQTDAYGVFALGIGTREANNFKKLRFDAIDYFLKVEVKRSTEAVYSTISDAQLMSVPYARTAANGVPVGTVVAFAGPVANIPVGWLLCDGNLISSTTYPHLFAAIQYSWGGSGSSFNLPDMRGMFLRGVSGDATTDPDRGSRIASNTGGNTGNKVGTKQTDDFRSHIHPLVIQNGGSHSHYIRPYSATEVGGNSSSTSSNDRVMYNSDGKLMGNLRLTETAGSHTHNFTLDETGGNESRPSNVYVYYIIKY